MSEEELRVLNRDSPDRTHDTQCSTPGTPSAKGLKVTRDRCRSELREGRRTGTAWLGQNLSAPERAGCAFLQPQMEFEVLRVGQVRSCSAADQRAMAQT